ncbi:hypothetical protein ILYODFUR_026467, partial [Ilyodon furcidens]
MCNPTKAHVNGSVWKHPGGMWTATMETVLKGRRAFLRVDAKPWPELSVEAVLDHDSPALRALPKSSRLRLSSSSGVHDAEVLVQMEECSLRASGGVMSQPDLQVSLLYNNNCTMIQVQELGSPNSMQASGSLLLSPASVYSHIFIVKDGKELHTVLTARQTEDQNEAFLNLKHSMPLLRKLGLPVNASLTINSESHNNGSRSFAFNSSAGNQKVELGSAEGKIVSLQSQCGDQQAGLRLHLKSFPLLKEMRGTMWHNSSWLHHQGLPLKIEGLGSIKGALSQLRSRAQLSVDGHKLLISGLNVSGADGHLAVLLSYSPTPLNQTRTQHRLDTVLTVQFK